MFQKLLQVTVTVIVSQMINEDKSRQVPRTHYPNHFRLCLGSRTGSFTLVLHSTCGAVFQAPMPTASTAQILGNNESFEPYTPHGAHASLRAPRDLAEGSETGPRDPLVRYDRTRRLGTGRTTVSNTSPSEKV